MSWQPIETAPTDGRMFLAHMEGCAFPLVARFDTRMNSLVAYAPPEISPFKPGKTTGTTTHWMPLPEPPK